MAIDGTRNELWFGTPAGLMQLNTRMLAYTILSVENNSKGLPFSDALTVLIDSTNTLCVGLKKKGEAFLIDGF
ncbi:hypothetical protein ACFO4O_13975 [Glaciecola siphonariae]|uniref:Uncharacterized protein n=1 Tax=Glaciecola siphonariae TaxID=521012 RepID=A0ABV9LXJ1_9ALTE